MYHTRDKARLVCGFCQPAYCACAKVTPRVGKHESPDNIMGSWKAKSMGGLKKEQRRISIFAQPAFAPSTWVLQCVFRHENGWKVVHLI